MLGRQGGGDDIVRRVVGGFAYVKRSSGGSSGGRRAVGGCVTVKETISEGSDSIVGEGGEVDDSGTDRIRKAL